MTDFTGKHLGHYRLEHLLGTGGFAEVYLATHIHLNTQVAIKVLHTRLSEEMTEQFHNEAKAIANLKHPHIVRMIDFGIEDGQIPYLVMDYLPGGTLRQYYTQGETLPLTKIALCIRQIAEALQYAHDKRYIHRDVKPDNILMATNSHLLLSDFSLAIVAHNTASQTTQQIAGTVTYMAPEQIEQYPRPASDQYALGVVVYEWLCGQPPFSGTMLEIATKHCIVAPPPLRTHNPAIPPAIEQVVLRALEKEWRARFPTIREFAQALQQASHTPTVSMPRPHKQARSSHYSTGRPPIYIRPAPRPRSQLPLIKKKISTRKQALWMSGYIVLMLIWWIPCLVDLMQHTMNNKLNVLSAEYLPTYVFLLLGAIMPIGALLAGALFGALRGGLVTAVSTSIIAALLAVPVLIWGSSNSTSNVIIYLYLFVSWLIAALVTGLIQQRRNWRSFGKTYLMMLTGATIVILGWAPLLLGDTTGGMTDKVTACLIFIILLPVASSILALPVTIIETLIQHNMQREEKSPQAG